MKILPGPLRILVVENDPLQRDDLVGLLQGWQLQGWRYEVYTAEGRVGADDFHQSLLDDAINKARIHRCHLAIVDMRLRDDSDPDDTSGLALVPQLAPTVSIIYSGKGDVATASEALAPEDEARKDVPLRAYKFIEKASGKELLKKAIEKAAGEIWHRREIEIEGPDELKSTALMNRFFGSRLLSEASFPPPPDEIDDLLRLLFKDTRHLTIEDVGIGTRTSGLLLRRRSVVLKVQKIGHARPVILKIALPERIEQEFKRFKVIEQRLKAEQFARVPEEPIRLWDVGGTIYSFVSNQGEYPAIPFSLYYQDHDENDINPALENFGKFWEPLYAGDADAEAVHEPLLRAYSTVWSNEWHKRLLDNQDILLEQEYPKIFIKFGLPNPIKWLVQKVALVRPGEYNDEGLPKTKIALTHGDLHGDNIFIDTRHDVWVIDFECSGPGPISQDWVELENDILTHLAKLDESDWLEYGRLLIDLLAEKSAPSSIGIDAEKFGKERKVIARIHKLADVDANEDDKKAYFWGLLLNTLFRLSLLLEGYTDWQQRTEPQTQLGIRPSIKVLMGIQRCLVFAGLLCHRLEHWGDAEWPPRDWLAVLDRKPEGEDENDEPPKQPEAQVKTPRPIRLKPIVIVTVNKIETEAVLEVFSPSGGSIERLHQGDKTYYRLCKIGNSQIYMVRSEMGNLEPGAARATVDKTIRNLHPQAVVMCGIACGLQRKKQKLGDILVSVQMFNYTLQKRDIKSGVILRGSKPHAPTTLLDRFRSGELDWKHVPVHFGLIMSGETLINDPKFRDLLLEHEPEAIGAEMEGFGLYVAADEAKKDWILVKGISDWGDGKKHDKEQPTAARNAARFVKHVLETGGF